MKYHPNVGKIYFLFFCKTILLVIKKTEEKFLHYIFTFLTHCVESERTVQCQRSDCLSDKPRCPSKTRAAARGEDWTPAGQGGFT